MDRHNSGVKRSNQLAIGGIIGSRNKRPSAYCDWIRFHASFLKNGIPHEYSVSSSSSVKK